MQESVQDLCQPLSRRKMVETPLRISDVPITEEARWNLAPSCSVHIQDSARHLLYEIAGSAPVLILHSVRNQDTTAVSSPFTPVAPPAMPNFRILQ